MIKILDESAESNLSGTGHSNFFLDMPPEARETKAKINYWEYIKMKSFCPAEETVNKTKRQPAEWEQTFQVTLSDKKLVSNYIKN